jgi:hypothetical protein
MSLTVLSKSLLASIKFESLIKNPKFADGTSQSMSIILREGFRKRVIRKYRVAQKKWLKQSDY